MGGGGALGRRGVGAFLSVDGFGDRRHLTLPPSSAVSDAKIWENEVNMFKLLSSECTNLFPSLFYVDDKCMVMVQENVNNQNQDLLEWKDRWTGDFAQYREQVIKMFAVFEKLSIFPDDLNICCNMIVNGPEIKVIDFGYYRIESNQDVLKNKLAKYRDR